MSVRACVVSYRSGEGAVRACRSALEAGAETVLADNSPGDGTADRVRERLPGVKIVSASGNLGFAAGCNLAARDAETDYLLFLNPDAEIAPDALTFLVGALEADPGAGIAGPALRFPDDRSQPSVRRDPTPAAILHQYTAFKFLCFLRGAYRRYRAPDVRGSGTREVEVLMGSVLLVRTSVFSALSGFDERYFMYYEEADLCRRAREGGSRVLFVPAAAAVHEGGASVALAVPRLAAARLISAQRYVARFTPRGRATLFRLAFLIGFPVRAMLDLLRDLAYVLLYSSYPPKHDKVGRKALEALASARLLTADFFRVAAG